MIAKVAFSLDLQEPFDYLVDKDEDIALGSRVLVPLGKRQEVGFVIAKENNSCSKFKLKKIIEILDSYPVFSSKMLKFSEKMSKRYLCPQGLILKMMLPSLLRTKRKLTEELSGANVFSDKFSLEYFQENIGYNERFHSYKNIIADKLKKGLGVIICLARKEDVNYFKKFLDQNFSNDYVVFFSQQNHKEQLANWLKVKQGKKAIALGTRMAVFAPFDNLGLIIVEKESFYGYFHEERPFYHLRDVALMLAEYQNASVIFSSDVISVSLYSKLDKTKIHDLRSHKEISKKAVDLSQFRSKSAFNPICREIIRNNLDKNKKTLVFWNHKGYSTVIKCSHCGKVITCPNCSVNLHYSSTNYSYFCFRCGFKEKTYEKCRNCSQGILTQKGVGVEKFSNMVKKFFPQAKIRTLEDICKNNTTYDVLIATEKIFYSDKNLFFDSVIVLDIDKVFAKPSFFSAEDGYVILNRLKSLAKDDFFVFSLFPDYYPISSIFKDDSWFYDKEIKDRKFLHYPPFGFLAEISIRAKTKENALKKVSLIFERIKLYYKDKSDLIDVFGTFEGTPFKLRGYYYYYFIVKTNHFGLLEELILNHLKKIKISPAKSSVIIR